MITKSSQYAVFALLGICGISCAQIPRHVGACGAPSDEIFVSSYDYMDGHEIMVERWLPMKGDCEDKIITLLLYDRFGKLVRRGDEHHRCEQIEETMTAARDGPIWTFERSRDLDHDERMDEHWVSSVPAWEVKPSELQDAVTGCAVSHDERLHDSPWVGPGALSADGMDDADANRHHAPWLMTSPSND